jgi:hypothetical protein
MQPFDLYESALERVRERFLGSPAVTDRTGVLRTSVRDGGEAGPAPATLTRGKTPGSRG